MASRDPAGRDTVLIVEDHEDLREILAMTLQHAGARPVIAGTVEAALGTLDTVRCQVIVTDLTLPDHDGRMAPRAGASGPRARPGDPPPARDTQGFDRWLMKPLDPMALCAEIAGLLGRRG